MPATAVLTCGWVGDVPNRRRLAHHGPGFGVATHEEARAASLRWREPQLVFVNSIV